MGSVQCKRRMQVRYMALVRNRISKGRFRTCLFFLTLIFFTNRLISAYGKKLRLYEIYKSRVNVSKHCDIKLEMYALYSELLWYKKLGKVTHSYLKFRAKRLLKEKKKHKII